MLQPRPPTALQVDVYFHPGSKELRYLPSKEYMANVHSLCIHPEEIPSNRAISGYPNDFPDPFSEFPGKFPDTLKYLELLHFPLFPSICNIKTLTKLVLIYERFPTTPKIILAVLGGNNSLEDVVLDIGFPEHEPPSGPQNAYPKPESLKPEGPIELNRLKSLSVKGRRPEDVKQLINLISAIPFPSGALVEVSLWTANHSLKLNEALTSIERFAKRPPTHLEVRNTRRENSLEFPGPNESKLCVTNISYQDMASAFAEEPLPFFEKVENLYFDPGLYCMLPPLKPLLFPSLETLTVENASFDDLFGGLHGFASKHGYDILSPGPDAVDSNVVLRRRVVRQQNPFTNGDSKRSRSSEYSEKSKNVWFKGDSEGSEEDSEESGEEDYVPSLAYETDQRWSSGRFVNSDGTQPHSTRRSQSGSATWWECFRS